MALVAVPRRCRAALAAGISIGRESLDDAIASEHPAVDREVAADHEGAHGSILLSQHVGLVCQVGLVLASID